MITPSFFASRSVLIKLFVGDAERAFVSEEDFEAADAALDDLFEIAFPLRRRIASRPCET